MKKIINALMCVGLMISLSIPAFATYVPSPSFNGFTHLLPNTTLVTSNENVVLNEDDIQIVTLSAQDKMTDEQKEEMTRAYDALESGDLSKAIPNLNTVLNDADMGITADDLAIIDMAFVVVSDDVKVRLADENAKISVSLKLDVDTKDALVVLSFVDNKWDVVPFENVIVNDDGTVTITMDNVGLIAFAIRKGIE